MIPDEPSLRFPPLLVEEMFNLIRKLDQRSHSTLLMKQNVFQALAIADCAWVAENGIVTLQGAATEFLSNEGLPRSCLGM